jgi:hypothetical protein
LQSVATCAKNPPTLRRLPRSPNLGSLGARTALPASLIRHRNDDAESTSRWLTTRLQVKLSRIGILVCCGRYTTCIHETFKDMSRCLESHLKKDCVRVNDPHDLDKVGKTAPRSEVFPYAMANGRDTKLPRLSLSLSRLLEAVS